MIASRAALHKDAPIDEGSPKRPRWTRGWRLYAALAGVARERGRAKPNRVGVVTGIAGTALLLVAFATGLTALASRWVDETAEVAPATAPVVSAPEDVVRKEAGGSRPVQSVLCTPIAEGATFCVVTYDGPACQVWSVTDDDPEPVLDVVEGASGSRSSGGVRCGS